MTTPITASTYADRYIPGLGSQFTIQGWHLDAAAGILGSQLSASAAISGGQLVAGAIPGGSNTTGIQVATFNLTAAATLTLHSVPLTIMAALGAVKTIIPVALSWNLTFNSAAFQSGGAVSLVYHGGSTNLLTTTLAAATINGGASFFSMLTAADVITGVSNTGLDLSAATGDFTTGDSTSIITIYYRQIAF